MVTSKSLIGIIKVLFKVFVYDGAPDYVKEGVFRIVDDFTGKMGFANVKWEIVIAPNFDFVLPFTYGLAAFNQRGHQEHLDNGHSVVVYGVWGWGYGLLMMMVKLLSG